MDATGATWKHLTASEDNLVNFYIASGRVVRKASTRQVRLLFDFTMVQQNPDTLVEHRSTVEVASIDCRGHAIAAITSTDYAMNMGRGRAVGRMASPHRERPVAAKSGSIDGRVIDFVCK